MGEQNQEHMKFALCIALVALALASAAPLLPSSCVWHSTTEFENRVTVKLVDTPEPIPSNGRAGDNVTIFIGGRDISAAPIFRNHHQGVLSLYFEIDTSDMSLSGADLCKQLSSDPKVNTAYLSPLPPEPSLAGAESLLLPTRPV